MSGKVIWAAKNTCIWWTLLSNTSCVPWKVLYIPDAKSWILKNAVKLNTLITTVDNSPGYSAKINNFLRPKKVRLNFMLYEHCIYTVVHGAAYPEREIVKKMYTCTAMLMHKCMIIYCRWAIRVLTMDFPSGISGFAHDHFQRTRLLMIEIPGEVSKGTGHITGLPVPDKNFRVQRCGSWFKSWVAIFRAWRGYCTLCGPAGWGHPVLPSSVMPPCVANHVNINSSYNHTKPGTTAVS